MLWFCFLFFSSREDERKKYSHFGFPKPRLFQTHVALTKLQQCPDLEGLERAELFFDPERKSHSSVMYKSSVYPFIHYVGRLAGTCTSETCGEQPRRACTEALYAAA